MTAMTYRELLQQLLTLNEEQLDATVMFQTQEYEFLDNVEMGIMPCEDTLEVGHPYLYVLEEEPYDLSHSLKLPPATSKLIFPGITTTFDNRADCLEQHLHGLVKNDSGNCIHCNTEPLTKVAEYATMNA